MLNVQALTELLSSNRDERLCKLWYIMTVNGTLLAHSQPVRINDLRRQAALAALSWQRYDGSQPAHDHSEDDFDHYARPGVDQSPLRTLVVESDASNVIIRKIQPSLLLVLEGGVPPGRARLVTRFTIESEDGTAKSVDSNGQELELSSTSGGAMQRQRSKLDALAAVIIEDFEHSGFRMPDDPSLTFF
jgi:hypothetical protein